MSMPRLNNDGCDAIRELIDPYVSGELAAGQAGMVEHHVAACPECARAIANRLRIRQSLKRAVNAEAAPDTLRASIGRAIRSRSGRDVAGSAAGNRPAIAGYAVARRWLYAAVATVLIVLAGWGVLRVLHKDEPRQAVIPPASPSPNAELAGVLARTAEVLKIGLGDHVFCAIKYKHADLHYTLGQMAREMGPEYYGLVSLVKEKAPGYNVVVGHQCVFNGRRFVHLILRNGDQVMSLAITRKGDTTFTADSSAAAAEVEGIPLFQAKLTDDREFQVTGFETRSYLAFLVSDAGNDGNLRMASALAPGVAEYLERRRLAAN